MIRIKNIKANKEAYINTEKSVYNEIVTWIKTNINEQTKSKAKIIQQKLLDFFAQTKKPTTIQVNNLLTLLKSKYLKSYPAITLWFDVVNSIDNDKTLYFNVFLNLGEYYNRQLIQENCHPNIDRKPVILDIEITDLELSNIIKETTLKKGKFEEI